jgi:hypothetical protein
MADIFVSYKREEKTRAKMIADALARKGYSVWWDPRLRAGESVDEEIEKELKKAQCVIVLWSRQSVNSDYVKDEARHALKLKKLIPVMIDNVQLPFRFENIQTADLVGWDGSETFAGFEKLLSDIKARLTPVDSHEPESIRSAWAEGAAKSLERSHSLVRRLHEKHSSLVLETPWLDTISVSPIICKLKWTKVANANGYVLASSDYDDFRNPQIVYEGQGNDFGYFMDLSVPNIGGGYSTGFEDTDTDKVGHYYRVKAKGDYPYRDSEWSNSTRLQASYLGSKTD